MNEYGDPEERGAYLRPEEQTPMCVNCGERPWGFGYCGEECKVCADDNF